MVCSVCSYGKKTEDFLSSVLTAKKRQQPLSVMPSEDAYQSFALQHLCCTQTLANPYPRYKRVAYEDNK